MENWTEIRTAYHVARLGTVSAAAEALGLHRVTVIRHIDLLEEALGEKLFIRHAKGYAPTQPGLELMLVAETTEQQFELMAARIKAQAQVKAGELVLTSLPEVAPILMPAIAAFRAKHPEMRLRHVASARTLKLEKGEAHVAIRSGLAGAQDAALDEPDNVVQPLTTYKLGLYGSEAYLARQDPVTELSDLSRCDFIAPDVTGDALSPRRYVEWLAEFAPEERIVFRSTRLSVLHDAVSAGLGLGFMPVFRGDNEAGLKRVLPEALSRQGGLSIVTHVDLHRTPRIQALVGAVKEHVPAQL